MELFELDEGGVAAFGDGGLLRWNGSAWERFKHGTVVWDAIHQAVYRNHRAMTMTPAELERRGIPSPPLDLLRGPVESVAWSDNFRSSLPLAGMPGPLLARLRSLPGTRATVYLILEEDEYESGLGDGRFLYPRAAFLDEPSAKSQLDRLVADDAARRSASSRFGYSYRLKAVEIEREESRNRLVADLKLESYEHCSVEDVVRLLSGA